MMLAMNSSQIGNPTAKAQNVSVTDEALTVDLADGRTISVPLAWYPRLYTCSFRAQPLELIGMEMEFIGLN